MAIRSGNAPLNVAVVTPAGTARADATAVPTNASPAVILAEGDGTAGIRLPKAAEGKAYFIKNTGGDNLKVYPADTTDAINAIAAGTEIVMATVTGATFVAVSASQWHTIPVVPS
jgi:hypothetical protein